MGEDRRRDAGVLHRPRPVLGHQLAATKAVEAALKLDVSAQTVRLRKLLNHSQFLQSHVLHVYFLAVPDYVGAASVLPLAKTHGDVVRRALKLKKLANDFTAVFGGRTLHPMSNTLRGWRKLPALAAIEAIRDRLLAAVPEGATVAALDEKGKTLSSAAFAEKLSAWRDNGVRDLAFVIGGADGLDGALLKQADLVLSLGPMTWPHVMVRGLLAEQLYRAQCIQQGHPYHRA